MKKIEEVSSLFGWRAPPVLLYKDSGDCGAPLACRGLAQSSETVIDNQVRGTYRTISDKSNEVAKLPHGELEWESPIKSAQSVGGYKKGGGVISCFASSDSARGLGLL